MNEICVTVPDGVVRPWAIESFSISEDEAARINLRAMIQRRRNEFIRPGCYKRLVHETRGVVMSNTPMEVETNLSFIRVAKGNVLINGLGLGMVLTAILNKADVTHVTVIEIDHAVIRLTSPHFQSHIDSGKLTIIQHDCFTYKPAKGVTFDAVWHDVWDSICADNLDDMRRLKLKYARRTNWQGCWCESDCRQYQRSFR